MIFFGSKKPVTSGMIIKFSSGKILIENNSLFISKENFAKTPFGSRKILCVGWYKSEYVFLQLILP